MAFSIGQISASVEADQSGFNASMNDVRKRGADVAKDVQNSFRNVGRRMQSIGVKMSAAITAPLVGVGGFALKTAADFESLRQSMDILNGSAEEGARNFERLKEFSAGTPFQLRGLAEAQNMLQGFGLSADEAFNSISMIGDIAAVTGGDIKGIGIAFGQAAAEGRLMTRDIRQLINQGVPAIKLLADTMGVAQSEVLDLASQGEISFEILQKAFRKATEEGGMFANGMAKQAGTLRGIFSTLKDNISIAMNEIGQSISETFDIKGLAKGLISQIQSGVKWFNTLSDETKRMAFTMAGVLGASGPIIAALGTLSLAIGAISAPIAGAAAAVGVAAATIISNWGEVEAYFTTGGGAQMWSVLQDIVRKTTKIIKGLWDTFGGAIIDTTKRTFKVISEAIRTALNAISILLDVWSGKFITDFDGFMANAEGVARDTFGRDGSMTIIFEEFLSWLDSSWVGRLGSTLSRGIGNAVLSATGAITGINMPFIESMDKQIAEQISFRQAERALRRAKQDLMQQAKEAASDDILIPAEIDISIPDTDLSKGITMFSGQENPIDRAAISAQTLGSTLDTVKVKSKEALAGMRADVNPALEGMTLLEIATRTTTDQISAAAQTAGQSLGQMFDQAVLHGQDFLGVVKNIIKQLASRVFVQGITAILTGGSSLVAGSLGSAIFGGIFHDGGIVPGSGEKLAMVQGGEGIFTPQQMESIGSMGGPSEAKMERAFSRALAQFANRLGPEEIFVLSQKGRNSI